MMMSLPKSAEYAAADLRKVRPTKADAKRNTDIDVMAVWRDDIEHTIRCKGWDAEQAAEFRALCGA
jgi:hypothetical protein